jgi:hypothetical protein
MNTAIPRATRPWDRLVCTSRVVCRFRLNVGQNHCEKTITLQFSAHTLGVTVDGALAAAQTKGIGRELPLPHKGKFLWADDGLRSRSSGFGARTRRAG